MPKNKDLKDLWDHLSEPKPDMTSCLLCLQGDKPYCDPCPMKHTEKQQLWDHLRGDLGV